jgi:TRAP-type transport system periplasmic protein
MMDRAFLGRSLAGTLALAATMVAIPGDADARVVLRANSQWQENHVGSQVDKWWAEEIKRRTDGEVDIQMFFAEALGKAGENLDLLRQGAIDIAMMSPGYFPSQLPFHAAPNSIPMAMNEVGHATQLMERLMAEIPAFEEEARSQGVKTLFFHHLNPYQLVCKEPVTSVADMRGKKMRTWGSQLPQAVEAVGGTPVTMMMPELYEGLSRGVIDCIPFSVDLVVNMSIYEVAPHISEVTIWLGPTNATWVSLRSWERLTPEQQQVIEEVSREAMYRDRDATIGIAEEARRTLIERGVTFHEFPAEEQAKWREANPDFFADFVAAMEEKGKGEDARRMIEIWHEVVGG